MDALSILDDVLVKTVKEMSDNNRQRAVAALCTLCAEKSNTKLIAEYLTKFHYSVCQAFFERIATTDDIDVRDITKALINDEQFNNKAKTNNIMFPKGFSAVLALAIKAKYQEAILILNQILSQSEKSGEFSEGCVNNFNKFVINKGGLSVITDIFQQVVNGSINCEESVKNRIMKFFKIVDDKIATDKNESDIAVSQTAVDIPAATEAVKSSSEQIIPEQTLSESNIDNSLIKKLEESQQEILTLLHKLTDTHSSIDSLTSALSRRDAEISTIRSDFSEKERHIAKLGTDLTNKDKRITELESEVQNLTERLRTSLQMDDISKNQEMITLKNDISEALKLDYADFLKSKDNMYNQDLFDAYRSTLSRIFKLLKRYGISCQ